MKKLMLIIIALCVNTLLFSQTRIDIGEVYGATLKKTVNATKQKMYRINTQTLLDVSKSEKEQMEVKMSFFDKDYEIVLMENTALENTPAYYTDKEGNLKQDYPSVKLYAGYLKSDTTKAVRFSVMNDKYINGYINTGDDLLYLYSAKENEGNTLAFFGSNITDSNNYSCGTAEPEMTDVGIMPMATNLYDFESVIRIMKIAADADEEFYDLYGSNSNNRILAILNEAEGLYTRTFNIAFQVTYVHYYQSNSPYTVTSFSDEGLAYIKQVRNHWNNNLNSIDRDVAMVFSGKTAYLPNGNRLAGIANDIGNIKNKTTSYMATFDPYIENKRYAVVDHELGHLCGGIHEDCQYNNNPDLASVMCQGF